MKHKFFSKRGFALFVSLMMCVNALSVTAWAGNFSQLQELINKGGDVVLDQDYTYGESVEGETSRQNEPTHISVSGNVNLNLNGYTITGVGQESNIEASVIRVEGGGNLTLKDEDVPDVKAKHNEDGSRATGTITGGTGEHSDDQPEGGGVIVKNGGTFTMKGGSITGNTAGKRGGGVYVEYNAKFTMEGGTISNNKTTATNGVGGGVTVWGGGTFTMTGGTITENSAQSGSGVYLCQRSQWGTEGGEFTMTGGTITGNIATGDGHEIGKSENSSATITGGTIATADEGFIPVGTCRTTNGDGTTIVGHNVVVDEAVDATCTSTGLTAGQHCTGCNDMTVEREVTPMAAHSYDEGVITREPAVGVAGEMTYTCTACGDSRTEEIDPLVEEPVVIIPDAELPLADAPEAEIADEEVPLAGLVSVAQLLDALYRHEDSPAVELPEEFPFAEHDYAAAICWGLDNALVLSTEEEPLDPDEIITVALLREVLENFVAYKGVELTVTVDGEDDELVMDLGDRLSVFFQLLDEAAA